MTHKLCIYCGETATKVRQGEHIIQRAIGGGRTITETSGRLVCNRCNNGVLSRIDEELCVRSYLAMIASQEIDASLWQVWDVEQGSGKQLIEARPKWVDGELQNLFHYPQIIFLKEGISFIGDMQDVRKFGNQEFENVLVLAAHNAFERFNSGAKKKGLWFEKIDRELVGRGYQYDPRVFTRHTISEIAKNIERQLFIVRYVSNQDKREALRRLESIKSRPRTRRRTQILGSHEPPMASTFDLGQTMRGLMKIGVNTLAAYCERTSVDRKSFPGVARLILGENHPTPELISGNGFICSGELDEMKPPDRAHAIRLTYLDNEWLLYISFFGGRLGAHASFPGPNNEEWNTIDIVAPIHSRDWQVSYSKLIRPIKARIRWFNLEEIAPTVKLQNSYGDLTAEAVAIRRPRQRP